MKCCISCKQERVSDNPRSLMLRMRTAAVLGLHPSPCPSGRTSSKCKGHLSGFGRVGEVKKLLTAGELPPKLSC